MHVETVRVVNPAAPSSFMTINRSDVTDEHELWPEQAGADGEKTANFMGVEVPVLDDDERSAAWRVLGKLLAHKAGISWDEWCALSAKERMGQIYEAQIEIDHDGGPIASAADPQDANEPPRIAKGPRGLWFVMRGEQRVSKGFATEAEAQAALENPEG